MSSKYFEEPKKQNRSAYLERIANFKKDAETKKRWCKAHPNSFFGIHYMQCVEGYRKGELCEEGNNEER